MGKKLYYGVEGKARKVKKIYYGVEGKARKIKKMYMGVGGKARPCFTGGELAYYGTITPLSVGKNSLAAANVGDHALFGGGTSQNGRNAAVDAYDKDLTRTTPTVLSQARSGLAATSVGDFALFGGGWTGSYPMSDTMDAYTT